MPLFLGVDMGTSSLKACVIDGEGHTAARAKVPSETLSPEAGMYEVDGEKCWWRGFLSLCGEISRSVPLSEIAGICVSSVCGSFIPVDGQGRQTHNAILYGIDRRAVEQADGLNAKYGPKLAARLGGPFTTHSVFPKILWLKKHRPDVFSKTAFFIEPNNFVTYRLTGERAWDFPSAAGTTLVDRPVMEWPRDLFDGEGVDPARFPPLRWPLSVLGRVTAGAGRETGLPEGIPVAAGACDINAEAAAAKAFFPGDCVVVFGSTVSLLLTTERPAEVPGFVSGMSLLEGTFRIGAATASGSRFLQWMNRTFRAGDPEGEKSPTGILILPWLDGARTPFHNPEARMTFSGMDSSVTPGRMIRAGREALGYELSFLLSRIGEVRSVPDVLDVSGGLCNDRTLMGIISSITGKKLRLHRDVDASYGDALLAAAASGSLSPERLKTMGGEGTMVFPDRGLHEKFLSWNRCFRELAENGGTTRP
ncbi:FGGY family carbohydrate kinase [Aminivibrio sp.]|uniref:FGGY family carbohydrate kinase n=1 Tax=Aminivibrio sp. TaxID=1872489 RepID=UPI001A5CF382|nr:FGGY family carbohydrate kinase [Aminivibrio sp.]MBL3539061.1 hypothetical protein [Aminivibrio sp.]